MNVVSQILALLGIVAAALLVSGLRPAFLIPAYGVLALAAVLGWSPKRPLGLSPRVVPCLVSAGVFFGYVLLRTALSPVEYIARPDLFMVLGALIVYLVTALCATSPTSRVVFTTIFLLLACAQVVVGAVQFSKGNNFMPFDFLPRTDYGSRASGFYGCPNHLAGFLEVTMLMALSLAFWSRWKLLGKIVAGYVAIVCIVGLALTGSRGGYASAAVGLFVFAIISLALARNWMWREIWLLLVTVLVFAVIGAGYLAYAGLHSSEYLANRVSTAGADAPLRFSLWNAALHEFQLSPIFGTGSGTYLYYGRLFREVGVRQDPVYAHSDVLQLLAEFGLIAVAGLGAFLFFHIRSGWKFITDVIARRTIEGERDAPGFHGDNSLALTTAALCSVAALLTHSVVDFNLHIPPNTLVMAFIFGTLANPFSVLVPEAKVGTASAKKFLRWIPLTLPMLGLALAFTALPKWRAERFADQAQVLLADWRFLVEPELATRAASLATSALALDPKNPGTYLALGDSYAALAEMEDDPAAAQEPFLKALDAYRRGTQVAPQDSHLVVATARTLDALKRFDEATPFHQRAIALDGESSEILWDYGNHFYLQGNLDAAETQFKKALAVGNTHAAAGMLLRIKEDRQKLAPPTAP